jgi:hypothetical protein
MSCGCQVVSRKPLASFKGSDIVLEAGKKVSLQATDSWTAVYTVVQRGGLLYLEREDKGGLVRWSSRGLPPGSTAASLAAADLIYRVDRV